jgi:peptide/nickel transport system permease protein
MAEAVTAPRVEPMAEATRAAVRRNGLVVFGAGIIVVMVLLALFAGVVAPYDPTEMKVADALKRPSLAHPFGTDRFGRDVLSRWAWPSRASALPSWWGRSWDWPVATWGAPPTS